ncbi:MAG: hypothetical protein J07HX5_01906, partial [halophilic archaeon J07HX5]
GWGFETTAEQGVAAPPNWLLILATRTVADHRGESGRTDVRAVTD